LFLTPVTLKASKWAEMPLKLVHIGNHIRYARPFVGGPLRRQGSTPPCLTELKVWSDFLEASYPEAVKVWPGNPPEDSRANSATFRLKDGGPVVVKMTV
jgi:hypothetical protein